jgi:hypothetical protein
MMEPGILPWLWLIWGLGVAAIVVPEVSRRRRAGRVLLDLGVREEHAGMGLAGRKPRLIVGILMLSSGLVEVFPPRFRVQGFMFLAWGSFSVIGSIRRRLQFREAGVLGRKLFRWQDIQDYSLSPKGGLTLKLSGEWIGCIGYIPPPYRQEAATLIASKAPVLAKPAN